MRKQLSIPATFFLVLGLAGTSRAGVYNDMILADGPVSYWTFDESATGTGTVLDSTSNNDGTFGGTATRTGGLIGTGAAQFNATNTDTVNVGNGGGDFSFASGMTVEAMFTTNWAGSTYREFFRKEDGGNRILFSFQAGDILSFGINDGGGYSELDMVLDGLNGRPTVAQIADGNPHHVAATYDASSGFKAIYVDGQLCDSTTRSPGTNMISGGSASAHIGSNSGVSEPFSGVIDEPAVYGRALANTEIFGHHLVGTQAGHMALPVSYWSFDESSSGIGTAYDGIDGNDGTFVGTATRTTGLIGSGAAQFNTVSGDGVNVSNGVGHTNNFNFTTGITVEALIQADEHLGDGMNEHIFRKEDSSNRILFSFQGNGAILSFGLNVGGYAELDMPLDGNAGRPTLAYFQDGNPHHLLATYDSITGEKAIWVDGTKRYSALYSPGTLIVSGGGANAYISRPSEPFTGIIDEMAIYDMALSAGEVAWHWDNVQLGRHYYTIPEPTAILLLGLGALGLLLPSRRRRWRQ